MTVGSGCDREILRVSADGVSTFVAGAMSPALSADGRVIAYVRVARYIPAAAAPDAAPGCKGFEIVVRDLLSGVESVWAPQSNALIADSYDYIGFNHLSWSPDGSKLAVGLITPETGQVLVLDGPIAGVDMSRWPSGEDSKAKYFVWLDDRLMAQLKEDAFIGDFHAFGFPVWSSTGDLLVLLAGDLVKPATQAIVDPDHVVRRTLDIAPGNFLVEAEDPMYLLLSRAPAGSRTLYVKAGETSSKLLDGVVAAGW